MKNSKVSLTNRCGEISQLCLDVVNSREELLKASHVAQLIDAPWIASYYLHKESRNASIYKILERLANKKQILKTTKGQRSWFSKLKKPSSLETWKYKTEGKSQKNINFNISSRVIRGPDLSKLDIVLGELQEKRRLIDEDIQAVIRTVELLRK